MPKDKYSSNTHEIIPYSGYPWCPGITYRLCQGYQMTSSNKGSRKYHRITYDRKWPSGSTINALATSWSLPNIFFEISPLLEVGFVGLMLWSRAVRAQPAYCKVRVVISCLPRCISHTSRISGKLYRSTFHWWHLFLRVSRVMEKAGELSSFNQRTVCLFYLTWGCSLMRKHYQHQTQVQECS